MSMSPLSPEEIRAAAEVHRELGPEFSDAVVASFLDKVDREIAAQVEARLATMSRPARARRFSWAALAGQDSRRALVRGVAIGVCASGAVASVVAVGMHQSAGQVQVRSWTVNARVAVPKPLQGHQIKLPGGQTVVIAPPPGAPGNAQAPGNG